VNEYENQDQGKDNFGKLQKSLIAIVASCRVLISGVDQDDSWVVE
jgi:hypothetical protein